MNIIKHSIEQEAATLHLVNNYKPFFRINGENAEIDYLDPLSAEETLSFFEELLTLVSSEGLKDKIINDYKTLLDTTFSVKFDEATNLRINIHQQNSAPALSIKFLKQIIPTPEALNLPTLIYEMCELNQGLILITGPVGNGKTTTMAAMINIISRNLKRHILAIESPREFPSNNLNSFIEQREVGVDTPSFENALQNAMKQDFDIIFVSDLASIETIELALNAAESGHLVVANMNTIDSYQTLDRLISSFPEWNQNKIRNQLANVLHTIMSQRLVPSLDLKLIITTEILKNNYTVKNIIRDGDITKIPEIIEHLTSEGMHLFSQDLIKLVQNQKISFQTAIKFCDEKKYFEKIAQEMLKES